MKNESNDVIFRKEDRNYYYNDHSNSIMETYLRQVYDGSDREELLRSSKNELTLSERAVADFEAFLNENIMMLEHLWKVIQKDSRYRSIISKEALAQGWYGNIVSKVYERL